MRGVLAGLLTTVVAFLALPLLLLRPKTRPGLGARLGLGVPDLGVGAPRIWAHAASAGDARNLWPVVRAVLAEVPGARVLLTTVTDSGRDMAASLQPAPHAFTFLPLDAPGPVRRFMRGARPDLVLLECTELWPILLAALHARGVPVVLCNARLSARSLPRYRRLFSLLPNPVPALVRVLCLSEADAERYRALGATPERVHAVGNCKFDAAARGPSGEKVEGLRAVLGPGRFMAAGSTHAGEEGVVLDAFQAARSAVPALRLVWAPRYLDHAEDLLRRARERGLASSRRSAGSDACARADVILLDTMGELSAAYACADVALVGGSWVERGGQNILEPAAVGVPVLHGPHMFNLPELPAALDGRGALEVPAAEIGNVVARLLLDDVERQRMGATGRDRVLAVAGAAERHVEHIRPLLKALPR